MAKNPPHSEDLVTGNSCWKRGVIFSKVTATEDQMEKGVQKERKEVLKGNGG